MTLRCSFPQSFAKNQWFTSCQRKLLHSVFYSCHAKLLSHAQLFVTPWTVTHQTPLSLGILQARILKWVAMPSSRGSSWPRDQTHVSCIAGGFFTAELLGKPVISHLENANQNRGIPLDTHWDGHNLTDDGNKCGQRGGESRSLRLLVGI